jgi:hypothetical protein
MDALQARKVRRKSCGGKSASKSAVQYLPPWRRNAISFAPHFGQSCQARADG